MPFDPQSEPARNQMPMQQTVSYPGFSVFWKAFRLVAIGLLALGILFRFANLGLKPYWLDEAFTSLRLTGYTNEEVLQQIENRTITAQDLQKFQQPVPEKNTWDTIEQLAVQEPQLTPLYFVILRSWVQAFGASIATIRSLSVIFSLLAFPCLYWLCLELFASHRIAWVSIALVAVSPIYLIYAQEARPSSLWILTTILSCALLLRAMRKQTAGSWALYALSMSIGLYSHLFAALVWLSHGVYVLLSERFRFDRPVKAFSLASIGIWISFSPWILFGLLANKQAMAEQSQPAPISELVRGLIRGISLVFVDFNLNETSPRLLFLLFMGLVLSILIFVSATVFLFSRSAPSKAKLFVLSLIAVPFGVLVVSDLVFGASRSSVARYFLSAYLGIQLAAAFVLTTQIDKTSSGGRSPRIWVALMGLILAIGLASSGLMARSEFWWNKADANAERQLAQTVNRAAEPIVITDAFLVWLLSFSHSLDPDVRVQVLPETAAPTIPQAAGTMFLFRPSEALQNAADQLQPIQVPLLWQVGSNAS